MDIKPLAFLIQIGMKYKFTCIIIILFLTNAYKLFAQEPLKVFNNLPHSTANLNISPDNLLVYTTAGANRVLKIDANFSTAWELISNTVKKMYIVRQATHHNGLYIVGEQALSSNGENLERHLFIIAYDECLNPIWHKIFLYTAQFDDTTITLHVDDIPRFREIWSDEENNLYILSANEDDRMYNDSVNMIHNTNYISKFSKNGDLLFRKMLINTVYHSAPYLKLSTNHLGDKRIIYGGAYYIPEHGGNIVFNRPTICVLDTAGNCVTFRYYNSYHYFAGSLIDFKFVQEDSTFIGVLVGIGFDTILNKEVEESHVVKYDYQFNELKRISSSERDSEYFHHTFFEFDTTGNIVIHVNKTFVYEDPHWDKRRRYPYFAKYDKDLNLIDSIPITYLNYKSGYDSLFGFIAMYKNPQNPNSIIITGNRRYGLDIARNIILRINAATMLPDSTVYPSIHNDTLCSTPLSGTINRTTILTDTIVINKRVNRKYNQLSGASELLPAHKITLTPNPTTTQVHIKSPIAIERYTLTNTNGTTVQSGVLDASHSIEVSQLPPGLYFLQLQLVNGQTVTKKVVRSK